MCENLLAGVTFFVCLFFVVAVCFCFRFFFVLSACLRYFES